VIDLRINADSLAGHFPPVTLSGAFHLWLSAEVGEGGAVYLGHPSSAAFVQFDREVGAMIRGDTAATQSDEAFFDNAQPPLGPAALRVRRDATGAMFFKWPGMAEQPAVSNTLGTATLSVIGRDASTGSGLDGTLDPAHKLKAFKIVPGDLTESERAAIETDLFGFTL